MVKFIRNACIVSGNKNVRNQVMTFNPRIFNLTAVSTWYWALFSNCLSGMQTALLFLKLAATDSHFKQKANGSHCSNFPASESFWAFPPESISPVEITYAIQTVPFNTYTRKIN